MSVPVTGAHALLAHQGGWDEIAFVVVPIALLAGLLVLANRRADRSLTGEGSEGTVEGTELGTSGPDTSGRDA
jgi:hypothetical protein